jgi:hypothetical protein
LDGWRGTFHLVLLVDHLPFLFPGLFTLMAGLYEAFGYFSVAEGFVFLSGYVTGLVYTRVKQEKGARAVWQKALARAFTIYATYVVADVFLLLLVKLGGIPDGAWATWSHLFRKPFWSASAEVASLLWQPNFLEILPMYSVFLVFAPAIIAQLDRRKHWLLLGISILIWSINQFDVRDKLLHVMGAAGAVHLGYFNSFAWQILFIAGLICGHRSYRANKAWLPKGRIVAAAACVILVFFFAWRHHILEVPVDERWIQRSSLGPLRLLNFACVVFFVARFRGALEKLITWKGLAFLSRHSLQVFAFHLVPIYGASLLITGKTRLPWWSQLLFIGFCMLGLFYIAWLSSLAKGWLRKPAVTRAAPAPAESTQPK